MTPSAILVHVPDVAKGLEWYKKAFPEAVPIYHPDFDFTVLDLNGFSLEIVQADEKVGTGKNGLSMCQVEDPFGNLIGLRGTTT
ncbi:TPA: glyoxalase/bleomycin resistance/dioxygenase family protein [Vibrio parahaemolyticus]